MNRQTFLNELKESLQEHLSDGEVANNLRYYSEYIDAQINLGRDEGNVLRDLGDPRLLAKTIIATAKSTENSKTTETVYQDGTSNTDDMKSYRGCFWDTSTLWGKIKVVLLLAVIVAIFAVIVRFMVRLLYFLLPILIIVIVIGYFVNKK